jgi:hypothetical protein
MAFDDNHLNMTAADDVPTTPKSTGQESSSTVIRNPAGATGLPFITVEDTDAIEEYPRPFSPTPPVSHRDMPNTSEQEVSKQDQRRHSITGPRKRLPRKEVPRAASAMEGNAPGGSGKPELRSKDVLNEIIMEQERLKTLKSHATANTSITEAKRASSMPLAARNLWASITGQRANIQQDAEPPMVKEENGGKKKSVRDRLMSKLPKFLRSKGTKSTN